MPTHHIVISMWRYAVLPLFICGYVLLGTASAQSTGSTSPSRMPRMPIAAPRPEGAVDCFDYYRFGSAKIDVEVEPREAIPGVPLHFWGKVVNENTYPLVDVAVYVKIFEVSGVEENVAKQNGYPLVAFEKVAEGLSIAREGSVPFSFSWNAPQHVRGGEYEAAFYIVSADRFNFLGLTFTDDISGNKTPFVIHREDSVMPLHFDKNTVTFNEVPFHFASYPPHIKQDDRVGVSATVVNESDATRSGEITWFISKWDALREENVVHREKQSITLKPQERKNVTYTPPVLSTGVHFVSATISDGDAKSLLHMRFVRDGIDDIRLNFPAVTQFPLKAGEEMTLFSCVHSTNLPVVKDSTLTLTLKDKDGNNLHTYTYAGDITGNMMGVKDIYTPTKDHDTFSLIATLTRNGKTIDTVNMRYACADIDSSLCSEVIPASETASPYHLARTHVFVSLGVLILLGVFVLLRLRKKQ